MPGLLTRYVSDPRTGDLVPFGEHHEDFWNWVWSLEIGVRSRPMICIWPRGGAKSTSAEMAGVAVGARQTRRYVLYICETLERAEDHVQNVAGMLESREIERYYPHVADRMVSKFGSPKGWRRNRLRAASGFTVDAIGLDVAARGIKLDDVRPDLMIFDDIDGEFDSAAITAKKIATITKKFLPAGSPDLAVLGVQNLIHPESIFSRLAGTATERADFLHERIVSGPFPAVHDLTYEERDNRYVITGGRPIWQGMDLERCQDFINRYGISAFLSESQQEVDVPLGGMFDHIAFRHCDISEVPDLTRVTAAVDPAVTDTDESDANGIQIDGLAADKTVYRLWSWEQRSSSDRVLTMALIKAVEYGATTLIVETNQGGDLWQKTYDRLCQDYRADGLVLDEVRYHLPPGKRCPRFVGKKAGSHSSKAERASQMLTPYEHGQFVHVRGTHIVLEKSLRRFPKTKPFDLTDASYWASDDLIGGDDLPYAWLRNDPDFRAEVLGEEGDEERAARRLAAYEQSHGL